MSGAWRPATRADAAVPAGTLGCGERVQVLTRAGRPVVEGTVVSAAPTGVVIESGHATGFYVGCIYLFVPTAPPPDLPWRPRLTEALAQGSSDQDAAASESPVAAADLPADIRQAVAPQAGLGPDGRDRVLAAVGEACLGALRRTSVAAEHLYALVAAIQAAAGNVLDDYAQEAEAEAAKDAPKEDPEAEEPEEDADEDPEAGEAVAAAQTALKGLK